jgi:hypothetical protein
MRGNLMPTSLSIGKFIKNDRTFRPWARRVAAVGLTIEQISRALKMRLWIVIKGHLNDMKNSAYPQFQECLGSHLIEAMGVIAFFGVFFFAPPKMNAQACTGNSDIGCSHLGATCSPVTTGTGQSGHCTTPLGFPKGERSCECTGVVSSPKSCGNSYDAVWTGSSPNDTKGWTWWKVPGSAPLSVQNGHLVSKGGWAVDLGHLGGHGAAQYPLCNNIPTYGIGPFAQVIYMTAVNPCLDVRNVAVTITMALSQDFKRPDPSSELRLWLVMWDEALNRYVNYEFAQDILGTHDQRLDGQDFSVQLKLSPEFSGWKCFGANSDYTEYRSACRGEDPKTSSGYGCAETDEQFRGYLANTNTHLGFVFTLPTKGSYIHTSLVGQGSILIRRINISSL